MDYWLYRDMVLAKTNGRDIHSINQMLGWILNHYSTFTSPRYRKLLKQDYETSLKNARKAIQDIGEKTGVYPSDDVIKINDYEFNINGDKNEYQ